MSTRTQRITIANGQVQVQPELTGLPKASRKIRRPVHSFQLRQRPYQIQPFLIAPVLPGETLDSAAMQARAITDPVVNDLLGWWAEYYYFYVTIRQACGTIEANADGEADRVVEDFFVNGGSLGDYVSGVTSAENYFVADGGIDWVQMCLDAVIPRYFREEGETGTQTLGGCYQAAAVMPTDNWLDSLIVDDGSGSLPSAHSGARDPFEWDDDQVIAGYEEAYKRMLAMTGVELTYQDYLRQQGVGGLGNTGDRSPGGAGSDPELIRYLRDFKYPGRVIDPATGAPSAAGSWAVSAKIDQPRFFKEPGFLFGVSVFRPKVYLSKQRMTAATLLDSLNAWLPMAWDGEKYLSLRNFAAGDGPLDSLAGYWVDVKDLFLYGEQFVNFSLTSTDAGLVALPASTAGPTVQKKYVASADIDALFVDAAGGNKYVRQDGVTNLRIKSRLRETT